MLKVATMKLAGPVSVEVSIVDAAAARLDECVYAWKTPSGDWLRVGTSMGVVSNRLLQYARHISNSLAGKHKPTPLVEAEQWKALLEEHGELIAYVHQPEEIGTIAGNLRPYHDVERVLIKLHMTQKRLNRSAR